MTSKEIPDLTKLLHQMALTDSKHKELYAESIMRLESLKKESDPVALAHARQISFVRIAAEFKENLDHLSDLCGRAKATLLQLESVLADEEDEDEEEGESVADADSLANLFNEHLDNMGQYVDLIEHIVGRFNTSQQVIIKDQIKIDDILTKYATIAIQLYESKGDITDDIDEYKMAMESLCADISTAQQNLVTLGIKLFPAPQTSKSKGGKKKKAT